MKGYGPSRVCLNSSGYLVIYLPHHPLATVHGQISVHRAILFANIGEGPHLCHWCSRPLSWGRDLFTDHLNNERTDNRPENLVASCHACNTGRHFIPWQGDVDHRHGTLAGYTLGCRCSACRGANRDRSRESRVKRTPLEPGDPRHGSMNGYYNYRCRCDVCRAVGTDYSREWKRKKREAVA